MYKQVVALVMLLTFCLVASALSISVPDSIEVKEAQSIFYVDITNESPEVLPVIINFYTTTKSDVIYPKTISSYSTITAKIIVYNDSTPNYHEVESKLEVYVGRRFAQKNVTLRFFEKEKLIQFPTPIVDLNIPQDTNTIDQNSVDQNTVVLIEITPVAWFGLSSFFNETNNFTIIDWVIFWFLVLVAAILVVAFVARVAKRI